MKLGLAALAIVATVGACKPSQTPRETARAVVLTLADGVKQADAACATLARAKSDALLAEACAESYKDARAALIAAEDGIDAWAAASAESLPCVAAKATASLGRMAMLIAKAGGKQLPSVADAIRLAAPFAEACHGG